ncbi:NAD(P)-dependent alcohol dehydrogenase [Mesorhizobium sp. CA13]|uniref:NAD(P)-dependent alcohol dehydrogenase n=1 Tax=unclassified Mesorhizobium TaxID=325217 RepID=UPI00112B71D1|nr:MULTISPECIES: NAD(P)-dependent alcohol dehydrogenase [unclassified Mesorhizobium]MBZ9857373.1 NAD(P)-dependent alcohol dehydrogenase [Mesorhizobium sp. CA13]MBZ9967790.1 NAD(P)-dependent alcohol dehydrogenase [Mesorhizobium sp. BR1-1-2]MCA0016381.1 NAD(P)-dependent alcohol dehydrogenase [Mesorhizobium sp. B294B1A1]MCA0038428.1 NAD(P)-dependent alcohol dehydrogenase [Mesorhizobium sp. B292B1B]TPM37338.1 NAD(P)-dependent alcohol dehydrogenase [Mesorhizobium sp. B2-3-2]
MTKVRALVLERQHQLKLRDVDLPQTVGPGEVRIKIHTVGVCGSDVHYYTHGRIGPFVVEAPMVLGHEAAGTIVETGEGVEHLKVGDRVCMEPGIPDPNSRASRLGLYNIDPAVRFWATPPIHGVLTAHVVHPANYTFKLPDNVSFAEGAMVEPFAVGMQAAAKAKIVPGDTAVVIGAGPIGTMVAIAALAGGCARAIVADLAQPKLDIAASFQGVVPVNIRDKNLAAEVKRLTDGWGADVIFECSGSSKAWETLLDLPRPGGAVVVVGLPVAPVAFDIATASTKEIRIEMVFRYAHQYDRAIALMGSGRVDLKPLISATFPFEDSIAAFDRAVEGRPADVKLQIRLPD